MQNKIKMYGDENGVELSTASVPKFIIEGLIGEKVTEIFKSIEVLNTGSDVEKLEAKSLDNAKATIAIAKLELEELVELLKDMKDATMTPRHRAVRKLAKLTTNFITKRADEINTAETQDDKVIVDCIKKVIKFVSEATATMSDTTNEMAAAVFFNKEDTDDVIFN